MLGSVSPQHLDVYFRITPISQVGVAFCKPKDVLKLLTVREKSAEVSTDAIISSKMSVICK